MKVFCHINELGPYGFLNLRTMVLAFDKVAIWGPCFAYLDLLRKSDDTIVSPAEILEYIDSGRIEVIAREWWIFNGEKRTKHRWEEGRPFTKWDKELSKRVDHGVEIVNDQDAKDKAEEFVEKTLSEGDCKALVKSTKENERLIGYVEKIKDLNDIQAAISLLRDAHNHAEGF